MLFVTVSLAQKPLDRGIHKRKTGGVSFLFGKTKDRADARFGRRGRRNGNPCASQGVCAPCIPQIGGNPCGLGNGNSCSIQGTPRTPIGATLEQKGLSALVLPNSKKRMLHRPFSRMTSPNDGDAPHDWASITGLALGVLALALIDSGSILMVWFWLLGLGFSVYGLFRTRNGNLRGRGLAVWGVVLFGISPLALFMGVVTGLIGIF